jgi:uncharacterized phage-associated protein
MEMRPRFNEVKATQAASRLLELRGGQMSYMKLVKLLYLIDRESIITRGRTITTDRHVSMPRGPVVSQILNLITEDDPPTGLTFWRQHISSPENFEVRLVQNAGDEELSRTEETIIAGVFAEHGTKSRWELVEFTHGLPEWQDPNGGSIPIEYRDILKAAGKTEAEIIAIQCEIESLAVTEVLITPMTGRLFRSARPVPVPLF